MNLFNFTTNFESEESCRNHFKEERDKIGVECKYGCKEFFWIKVGGIINAKNVEKGFLCEMEQ